MEYKRIFVSSNYSNHSKFQIRGFINKRIKICYWIGDRALIGIVVALCCSR